MILPYCWTKLMSSRFCINIFLLLSFFLLLACSSPLEQLVSDTDDLRIFFREESNTGLDVEKVKQLVALERRGRLPALRVRVDAQHSLVRELVTYADYRIEAVDKEYYVSEAQQMLLKHDNGRYVVFGIPHDGVRQANW